MSVPHPVRSSSSSRRDPVTFPDGTLVTGTSGLAVRTHLDLFAVAATTLYIFLLRAWGTVLTRTTPRRRQRPALPANTARGH